MTTMRTTSLPELYLEDETAWLEQMSELVRARRLTEVDLEHLAEYLSDMARRDRREMKGRLVILLVHLLKWEFQPERGSPSWRATIIAQRQELVELASRRVLRSYAEDVLAEAYASALERAAAETGLDVSGSPGACAYSVEQLFAIDV